MSTRALNSQLDATSRSARRWTLVSRVVFSVLIASALALAVGVVVADQATIAGLRDRVATQAERLSTAAEERAALLGALEQSQSNAQDLFDQLQALGVVPEGVDPGTIVGLNRPGSRGGSDSPRG